METRNVKPLGYESKSRDYFSQQRPEMIPFIPPYCRRVLDVGCGEGAFGQLLKGTRPIEVWGVEPAPAACAVACERLDRAIEAPFVPEADLPPRSFDAVVFNDVLEHLFNPGAALRLASSLLRDRAVVVASIPNFRHFGNLWDVVVRGDWTYRSSGILDNTHLRFFTMRSIVALFEGSGFAIDRIEGINRGFGIWGRKRLVLRGLRLLTLGAVNDMDFLQFAVVARPHECRSPTS